ncbi:MAG: DUF2169 domain-containing protein [Ketobacter sp.]|nr:DUF2169 domain-containing protein [Ketobacter sp.]
MWELNNKTPFAVGKSWGRDINGWHQWLVAVKGTYDISETGTLSLAEEQSPALLAPEYFGEPGQSSLKYDADVVAGKPATDILVNGTAHAPSGKASVEFAVALRINDQQKALKVLGERHWEQGIMGLKPSTPRPILSAPIRYERAFGGYDHSHPNPKKHTWDPRNPVGCGVVASALDTLSAQQGMPLHQFEYLKGDPKKAGPAGFGAVDSFWSPRRELTGTYDKAWQEQRHPLLPLDWDSRCLQCAPKDQQSEKPLRGGETIELIHLTPQGKLQFQLPRVYLAFTTYIDNRIEEHRAQLSSVIIEPDQRQLKMVWTTSLLCRNEADYLDQTIIRQKRYQ